MELRAQAPMLNFMDAYGCEKLVYGHAYTASGGLKMFARYNEDADILSILTKHNSIRTQKS
jgi:hypothetical protein